MAEFVKVAKTTDIEPGSGKCVEAKGQQIALFNVGGAYYAISETCSHAGGPLSEGYIDDNLIVICPWHGWCFNLVADESCAKDGAIRYPIAIDGDDISVEIP